MKYDPSKILYDQQAAIRATKLFDDVDSLSNTKMATREILARIREINPDTVIVLDTINLTLGWLTFPKGDDAKKVSYRAVVDLLCQYLAGVE